MWIHPSVFTHAGNQIMRRHTVHSGAGDEARWGWTFNASPRQCSIFWDHIEPENNMPGKPEPKHLLWALMFLNLYLTEHINKILAKADESTFRLWVWRFVRCFSAKAPETIRLSNRFEGRNGNVCLMSVDGVDFSIFEPIPFWTGYFSHKFQGPGVRYEIGICISTGYIVWFVGPFPCAESDIKIFRGDLMHLLSDGEKILADRGYNGEPDYIVTATDLEKHNIWLLRDYYIVRARHEAVNRRLKVWNILGHRFRHGVSKHADAFGAVAVIEQLKMENGEPMFAVEWEDYGLGIGEY